MSWIVDDFAVTQSSEVFKANIDSNFFSGLMFNNRDINFTTEDSKPLSNIVLFNSESFNFSFWGSMQYNRDISNLTKPDSFIRNQFKTRLRERDTISSTLETRKPFISTRLIFNPTKEVFECFIYSVRHILSNLAVHFRSIPFDNR